MPFQKATIKSSTLHQRSTKNRIARKTLTIIPLQKHLLACLPLSWTIHLEPLQIVLLTSLRLVDTETHSCSFLSQWTLVTALNIPYTAIHISLNRKLTPYYTN